MTAYTFRATFEGGAQVDIEAASFVSAIYACMDWRKRNRDSAFATELPISMIRKPILPSITMDAFALRHHAAQMAKLMNQPTVSDDELPTHPMQQEPRGHAFRAFRKGENWCSVCGRGEGHAAHGIDKDAPIDQSAAT